MALHAELTVRLDAGTLVNTFISQIGGAGGQLTSIPNPAGNGSLNGSAEAGASFVPAPLTDAIRRFGVDIPEIPVPAILQTIETALVTVEQVTSHDLSADVQQLIAEATALLEGTNDDGWIAALTRVAELLKNSQPTQALQAILALFTGGNASFAIPQAAGGLLPALASIVQVLAGLMVYESVLSEGERLTGAMPAQFSNAQAHTAANNLSAALTVNGQPLASFVAGAGPDAAAASLEACASRLEALAEYVSTGMGFGEATLVHFNPARAQDEIAAAGLLLRHPDVSALRGASEYLAGVAAPILRVADPGSATSGGIEAAIHAAETQVTRAADSIRNVDASAIVTPLNDGLTALTRPLRDFTNVVSQGLAEIRAALETVRAAAARLPIDDIAAAIRSVLDPVTQALEFLRRVVGAIQDAIGRAVETALALLAQVEGGVDQFKAEIQALFQDAKDFIDGLHLEQIVSTISGKVNEFVDELRKAELKPYFDTANSAINTAGDVVSAIPFGLVPESMKPDLDEALKPIRDVDAASVETEIESILQIGPDGKFTLRADIELSLAGIQTKFEELIAVLDAHHPRLYLQQLDQELQKLAAKIQALTPDLTLQPVADAIASLKSALGSFDLQRELQPAQQVFDQVIEALDRVSPAALLQPLAARVTQARNQIKSVILLDRWLPALDSVRDAVMAQLDALDEAVLGTNLRGGLELLQTELGNLPDASPISFLGTLVAGLMRSSPLRIAADSIQPVFRWITEDGASGSAEMLARAQRIAEALESTQHEVEAFDPASLNVHITGAASARSAAQTKAGTLPAGSPERIRIESAAARLDASVSIGNLAANRTRYLDGLTSAVAMADALRRTGVSEVDIAVRALHEGFAPLRPVLLKIQTLAVFLGIGGQGFTFRALATEILAAAPPERIVALVTPLFSALRARLGRFMDEILNPVRAAIGDLQALIALVDLQPLVDGVQSVFAEVRGQILAFSPNVLLHPQIEAFQGLQRDLLQFDPLAALLTVLNGLRDTVARIIGKLSAEKLLETPLAIYDEIVGAIRPLDVRTLMTPVLDAIDEIATQVDVGLDGTVTAFQHLQESLPPPGGGSSASVSVSVG